MREKGTIGENLMAIFDIYHMLEDKQSKDIYLNRLNYLLTGDFKYIRDIVTTYTPNLIPWTDKNFDSLLKSIPEESEYVLYGAGADAATLLSYCKNEKRFVGFCSNNKKKQEKGYLGFSVMSPEELLARKDLCVIISTSRARSEILSLLEEGGYPADLIFDGPMFYRRLIEDIDQYFSPEFMTFEDEEIFVDAGCCTLDTSIRLRKRCGSVKKVYAFEPDPHNYKVCLKAKEQYHFSEAEIIPCGTWNKRTTLRFEATGGGGSHICKDSDSNQGKQIIEVPVMPIDEAINAQDQVTMIKMDVEGAELESLKGAWQTIQRCRPKLAICIYHRPEHMVTIPLYIKELVPEYKLYIRHHSSDAGETVLYAIP